MSVVKEKLKTFIHSKSNSAIALEVNTLKLNFCQSKCQQVFTIACTQSPKVEVFFGRRISFLVSPSCVFFETFRLIEEGKEAKNEKKE